MGVYREYGQLVADTITTLTIPVRGVSRIELLLRTDVLGDDHSPIYFTYEKSLEACPDPVVEGNCEYVCAGLGGRWPAPLNAQNVYIKMVSAGAPKYALRVW